MERPQKAAETFLAESVRLTDRGLAIPFRNSSYGTLLLCAYRVELEC